jgi:hypothetical protein
MKRVFFSLILVVSLFRTYADEGMWLPMLLGKQVYNDMVKRGLKLTKEQLYSVNKASLKDAIIIFGGFCTGEIVSSQGLIFTNHHCGYDVIASSSSVEKNYLRDGFYARSRQEEIPAQTLYAEFLLRIEDVTKQVQDSIGDISGPERAARQNAVLAALNAKLSDESKSIVARISPIFKGNQFLAFVYQHYDDVRLVGAPPESVGKFGGDTDNWEWPRHTGDFSVFRVYMNKDGQPAKYSTENVPLKPKYFLPVSLKGVKDGDYAMIYGYPGGTNRYETSYGVKQKIDITNPTLVSLRDMRLKYMFEEMKKDPAVKLKLASDYASIANYWKFFDGETKQLLKYNVYDQKINQEEKFLQWAKGKQQYEGIFTDLAKAYDSWRPYSKHHVFINEGIFGSSLMAFAASLQQVENAIVKSGKSEDIKNAVEAADKAREEFIKSENVPSDQKILGTVLYRFYNEIDKSQHPIGFYEGMKGTFGDLNDSTTFTKYAANVFTKTFLLDSTKWNAFVKNPDGTVLQNDPAYATASAFLKNFQSKYLPMLQQFNARNNDVGRLYLKGSMLMDTVKAKKMYPDATFTMRVSFGSVKSYKPRDAVKYDYITTMKGVLEKYKPGDYEFDLPEKLVQLARKKDYGQYADKQTKDLVVGFITTNDITGGNSGSPVIDANGNLIGLAFDGNYEALSHKISFDKDLNRTICVDVRYVLWCIDKLGGAGNIVKELKLVR